MPDDSREHRARPDPSDKELLAYIAETCRELRSLGKGEQFRTLNYLLDQARIEADQQAEASPK